MWLTEDAKKYPETLRKYVFEVSYELYSYEIPSERQSDWHSFIVPLLTFIARTGSHLATLNYDDLLYEAVLTYAFELDGAQITLKSPKSGRSPYIRDGFLAKGAYRPESFDYCDVSAYYLHLHGTPLFAEKPGGHYKLSRGNVDFTETNQRRHIILAHADDKEKLIKQSEILRDYWERQLPKCIMQADEIILFGYSGQDRHLNHLIANKHKGAIRVIEWSGAGNKEERKSYWNNCFGTGLQKDSVIEDDVELQHDVILEPYYDILNFRDWEEYKEIPF